MPQGIRLYVKGDHALFTRPEMKAERVSYDVITPSASRGLLEAIYWKPQIRWRITRLHVLNKIQFTNIRRNEIGAIAAKPSTAAMAGESVSPVGLYVDEERQQRAALVLKDVAYVIEARFDILDRRFDRGGPELSEHECAGKHLAMFTRRAAAGQAFQQPYFGCREFPAAFELLTPAAPIPTGTLPESERTRDLGFMLHDIAFLDDKKGKIVESSTGRRVTAQPRFFRAEMKNGVIEVPDFATSLA